tara:strand:- start:26645 stop:32311 length:5667 start_codon:yes stop_codon:yes gene_type:complete
MGAFAGDEESMTGTNWENPLGFFERKDTRAICDKILHENNADWWKVANFDPDRVPHAAIRSRLAEFNAVVSKLDEGAGKDGAWVLKEPRFCVLYPILQRALLNPHVVIIVRNPLEVAKSLRRRNGFTLDAGLALWEAYMVAAIRASASSNPLLVSYDALVSDPGQTLEQLAKDLTARGVKGLDSKAGVAAVLGGLRREEAGDEKTDQKLTPAQAALWDVLKADTLPDRSIRLSSQAHETLLDFESDETARKRLEAELHSARQSLQGMEDLRDQLKTATARGNTLAAGIAAGSAKADQLNAQLAQATQHGTALKREVEDLTNRLHSEAETFSRQKAALDQDISEYEIKLAESRSSLERLTREMEESQNAGKRMQASLRWKIGGLFLAPLIALRYLKARLISRKNRQNRLLLEVSGLFEPDRYIAENSDIANSGLDPLDHYITTGWREGREPGSKFSARGYLTAYPDVAALKTNPLLHYLKHGKAEGRSPSPKVSISGMPEGDNYALVMSCGLFDEQFYLTTYPDVTAAGIDALEHFLSNGWREGRDPGPRFSCRGYLHLNPDVAASNINPLVHYVTNGASEGRATLSRSAFSAAALNGRLLSSSPPDLFAFRAARRTSNKLVILHAADLDAIEEVKVLARTSLSNTDIVILHSNAIASPEPTVRTSRHSSIFILAYPQDFLSAKALINLINKGPVTQYEQVLWVRAASKTLIASDAFRSDILGALTGQSDTRNLAANTFTSLNIDDDSAVRDALEKYFARLGRAGPHGRIEVPDGEIICIPSLICSQIRAYQINAQELPAGPESERFLSAIISAIADEADIQKICLSEASEVAGLESGNGRSVKAIAFYLPQFHPIEENDRWWGKGFTEWTNVTKARPLFQGHYQPQLPADLGFYDLRSPQTQLDQANLAHDYGLHGFCYYYYWFDGKKVLNEPIEKMLQSGSPNFPFCVCWANENWSRNWDGQNKHVLLEQHYSEESNRSLIQEFIRLMRDERYIRHNGKPVLLVYRIRIIPNWLQTAEMWREECRKAGIGEIHLCAVRFGLEPLEGQPADFGLDSFVIFPPHESEKVDARSSVRDLAQDFNGTIFDYDSAMIADLQRFDDAYPWPVHRGVMLGWDNTARRQRDSRIFLGSTPARLHRWLKGIVSQENRHNKNPESLVFVNAWNEWAEGTMLEPSVKFGRGYLDALRAVVGPLAQASERPSPIVEDSEFIIDQAPTSIESKWYEGAKERKAGVPTILVCAHVVSHHLFGAERSFLDVLDALGQLDVNVVVALPTDVHVFYTKLCQERSCGVSIIPYTQWRDDRAPDDAIVNAFRALIARCNVDTIYANTIVLLEPLVAARDMGCSTIVHVRELIDRDEGLVAQIGLGPEKIIRKVASLADGIVANSQETKRLFENHANCFFAPNVVEPHDLDITNQVGDTIRFAMASSNIPKKGLDDFIAIARACEKTVPVAEFVLVGPENAHTKALRANAPPGNIVFAGYADSPKQAMELGNVVLSLSHFAESFGRTVAEAQMARRPVIAYDWGAVPELITHAETGFLAPYRDINAVCRYVQTICETPGMISAFGEAGRANMLAHYTPPVLVNGLWKAVEATSNKPISILDAPRSVTIVVPVFNAFDATKACLESLKAQDDQPSGTRILMINDASTDSRIAPLLETFAQLPHFDLLTNEHNCGYTRTINIGINWAKGDDVVLLNSDAIVTKGWLRGLRCAAYSGATVATATAMSDNAGAFSFPVQNSPNPKPEGISFDDFANAIIAQTRRLSPVDVPTGSGFCMYIRRDAFDEIGSFDEEAFPRGYGEENDFCMRAIRAGLRNVISPYAYVFHVRSASFGEEKETLIKGAVDTVTARYPDYARLVKEAFGSDKMQALRAASHGAVEQLTQRVGHDVG